MSCDFFSIESLGVQCIPKCGLCRCGFYPFGSKPYTLEEERELNMISEGLSYDGTYWVATYPWIKDSCLLPNNYNQALKKLGNLKNALISILCGERFILSKFKICLIEMSLGNDLMTR